MRALAVLLLGAAGLVAAAFSGGPAAPAAQSVARVPATAAAALAPAWAGAFGARDDAYGAFLTPGSDHEAEGPPAVAAAPGGFAVLDPLRALVHFYDEAGAPVRQLSLAALGAEAASAVDLAVDEAGSVALLLARGAGAVALLEPDGALAARAGLPLERSPATGLALLDGALFAGFGDARAWQPLRPELPVRPGLPGPAGDCNAALLADGRAIARCHTAAGLRELSIEPDPAGPPLAAIEAVHADAQGGLCALVALRGATGLRRMALRADAGGAQAWADLGRDPPWFTHRAAAFTADGRVLRLTGDASGPRVLRGALNARGAR